MSDKPKLEKPIERIHRSWKLALEFGASYPVGKSERQKLLPDHPAPIAVFCGACGGAVRK